VKPRFAISFRYSNFPFYRPDKPYLIPVNKEGKEFRELHYGANGIRFNSKCK
jgi:hypothetical protein